MDPSYRPIVAFNAGSPPPAAADCKALGADREAGFSLPEVLVAAVLLLFIIMGIVPLFVQSAVLNATGSELTTVTNAGKSSVEEIYGLGFQNPRIVNEGPETERVVEEHFDNDAYAWEAGVAEADRQMERAVTLRQFTISDLNDDGILNQPFASPSVAGEVTVYPVHLREIEVDLAGKRGGGTLAAALNKRIVLRTLKAF